MSKEKDEKKAITFGEFSDRVAEQITLTSNNDAITRVIHKLVDEETTKRAQLLDKANTLYKGYVKDLEKCRPDSTTHTEDENGEHVETKVYSDKAYKEKQTLKKKIADLEVALAMAMGEKQDYNKLNEAVNKGGQQNNKPADQ